MHIGYWWERQKERDHKEVQGIGVWTILRWILETEWCGVDWIDLAQDMEQCRVLVNSCKHGNKSSGFITCWEVLE
jgi:hypothetical protein